MNLGKAYIEGIGSEPQQSSSEPAIKYIGDSLYKCSNIETNTKECLQWELVK
jgi:hypothetical protein